VIKVDGNVPAAASFGDSSKLELGQEVIAIGSALGDFRNTVTTGVISGQNRRVDKLDGLLQTDAAINHGNSGGPLLNLAGEIIGINTAVVRQGDLTGDVAEGLGFAVPSNTAKTVADQLIKNGKVSRPYLGVSYQLLTPELAAVQNLSVKNGALILSVVAGSPADTAKLAKNDVVTAVDGQVINEDNSLAQLLMSHKAGDKVTLTVVRDKQELKIEVTLAERTDQ
jgi:2-alkenal reductase